MQRKIDYPKTEPGQQLFTVRASSSFLERSQGFCFELYSGSRTNLMRLLVQGGLYHGWHDHFFGDTGQLSSHQHEHSRNMERECIVFWTGLLMFQLSGYCRGVAFRPEQVWHWPEPDVKQFS